MLRRAFARKNNGYTLVEVMVSLVIVTIVFVGLTETGLMALESNITNTLRDEAVHVAEKELVEARSTPFAGLVSVARPNVSRQARGLTVTYSPVWTVTDLDGENKRLVVDVTWVRRGRSYSHQATTIVRNR